VEILQRKPLCSRLLGALLAGLDQGEMIPIPH